MPIIISGDPTKSISLSGDQSKSIQASQVYVPPPAYVVAGVTQSHWLATNAVTSDGTTITKISDLSGTADLVGYDYDSSEPKRRIYEPTGWVSGNKTLPSFRVTGPTLRASQWASILSGVNKPVTIATLVQRITNYTGPIAALNTQSGPSNDYLSFESDLYGLYARQTPSGYTSAYMGASAQFALGSFKAIVAQWDPAFGFKIWRNGVKTTIPGARNPNSTYTYFGLCGNNDGSAAYQQPSDCRFAEFHIYSANLSEAECTSISADMMTRGGL